MLVVCFGCTVSPAVADHVSTHLLPANIQMETGLVELCCRRPATLHPDVISPTAERSKLDLTFSPGRELRVGRKSHDDLMMMVPVQITVASGRGWR